MHTPALHTAQILHTSMSYACDRETRECGEDYPELRKIERAYRLLERRLTRAAVRLQTRDHIKTVHDFGFRLADARADAAWPATLDLAKDAHAEARVAKIVR